jgi:hypothetical protein
MIQDFEALSKQFDALLNSRLGNKHLINPFFRISKGTPEQTKKYFMLNSGIPRPAILAWNLFLIPIIILKFSTILFLSLILSKQNLIFEQKKENTQVLFLSHGTKGNLLKTNEDAFFGLLPNYLSGQRNLRCTVLYTNQDMFKYKKNSKMLNHKNLDFDHVLLPKILPFHENFKYFLSSSRFALKALTLGLKSYSNNPKVSRILISSISSYFSRSTYSNYLLLNRVKQVKNSRNFSALFLTFEGHSFEQVIVEGMVSIPSKTDIFLYQHSPIVPFHYGVKSFLKNCNSTVTILTTGPFYTEYFKAISKLPSYITLGTNKGSTLGINSEQLKEKKIVYAPEGTNLATREFINLITDIVHKSIEFTHVLRLHPDLKLNKYLRLKLVRLRKLNNFVVSKSNLNSDLVNAQYLVFRSSAVGIESLKYRSTPIFYADNRLNGLNVLYASDKICMSAENPNELVAILKLGHKIILDGSIDVLIKNYFLEVNYKNLIMKVNPLK